MARSVIALVQSCARRLLTEDRPLVLAVSGGRDSMCLLHAVAACRAGGRDVTVATFDHGTGPRATEAVDLVRRVGRELGMSVVAGAAPGAGLAGSEEAWRAARWRFLDQVARERRALIATAHHRDDHLETVVMRVLRGAGGWGLSGLRAGLGRAGATPGRAGIHRPFLEQPRKVLDDYAAETGVPWVEDPSNTSMVFLRNRVRHQLLPALLQASPELPDLLDRLSGYAARLRAGVLETAEELRVGRGPAGVGVDPVILAVDDVGARRMLWAALLRSEGVILDRRGYERLGALDASTRNGATVPLSGGWLVTRMRDALRLHRAPVSWSPAPLVFPHDVRVGGWAFSWRGEADPSTHGCSWIALDAERAVIRPVGAGDRWRAGGVAVPRLVTRYLAEAGVPPVLRKGWPVIEANGEIVWVPGVRRFRAAPASAGRPTRILHCEHDS